MKCCNKRRLKKKLLGKGKSSWTFLEKEIAVMKKLDHDNVVKLSEVIDDNNSDWLYLIMEFLEFGGIFSKPWKKAQLSASMCSENNSHNSSGLSNK